jgi:hypothetical protein
MDYEPTLVFPFAVHFAAAVGARIYALPHRQFLLEKRRGGRHEFVDLTGLYDDVGLRRPARTAGARLAACMWVGVAGQGGGLERTSGRPGSRRARRGVSYSSAWQTRRCSAHGPPQLRHGRAVSLPFTLSVALLCTTSGADAFTRRWRRDDAGGLPRADGGCRSLRRAGIPAGGPLLRPLASVTASYHHRRRRSHAGGRRDRAAVGRQGRGAPRRARRRVREWLASCSRSRGAALSGIVVVVGVAAPAQRA